MGERPAVARQRPVELAAAVGEARMEAGQGLVLALLRRPVVGLVPLVRPLP